MQFQQLQAPAFSNLDLNHQEPQVIHQTNHTAPTSIDSNVLTRQAAIADFRLKQQGSSNWFKQLQEELSVTKQQHSSQSDHNNKSKSIQKPLASQKIKLFCGEIQPIRKPSMIIKPHNNQTMFTEFCGQDPIQPPLLMYQQQMSSLHQEEPKIQETPHFAKARPRQLSIKKLP